MQNLYYVPRPNSLYIWIEESLLFCTASGRSICTRPMRKYCSIRRTSLRYTIGRCRISVVLPTRKYDIAEQNGLAVVCHVRAFDISWTDADCSIPRRVGYTLNQCGLAVVCPVSTVYIAEPK